jgi:DnaJ-domain-containing protein 1
MAPEKGMGETLRETARRGLNRLQDRVVAFERDGGFEGLRRRVEAFVRSSESALLDGRNPLDPDYQRQVRQWYARLELPQGANIDEVRRAFRDLMRQYHPDRFAGDPATEALATRVSQELTVAQEGLLRYLGAGTMTRTTRS